MSHGHLTLQTIRGLLAVRAERGQTHHQQHPDLSAEPEASSALASAAALPGKGRNRCCRLM